MPKTYGLTEAQLKWIALMTMLVDHIGLALIYMGGYYGQMTMLYNICRGIGRISFPIYVFLLVEGYRHTSNAISYLSRLLIFAFISIIPADLAFFDKIYISTYQNIYFTLAITILMFICIDKIMTSSDGKVDKIAPICCSSCVVVIACIISEMLHFDYGWKGPALGIAIWLYHGKVIFYNGQRGRQNKYIFYLFYPAHLIILFLIRTYIL